MKLEFRTTRLEAQPIVGIRATVAMSEIGQAMGPLFGEVHGHIQQGGGKPAGMPLAIYHSPRVTPSSSKRMPVDSAWRVRVGSGPASFPREPR